MVFVVRALMGLVGLGIVQYIPGSRASNSHNSLHNCWMDNWFRHVNG